MTFIVSRVLLNNISTTKTVYIHLFSIFTNTLQYGDFIQIPNENRAI